MTNHWTDIGNSTLVVVMGANPSENHPACMAHVNNARRGPGTYQDRAGNSYTSNKRAAQLVVIDPRKTRTAAQADLYVRIRPGTDIAFINGLINYIIDAQELGTGLYATGYENKLARFEAYHSAVTTTTFTKSLYADGVSASKALVGLSKYTDARFRVSGSDYVRSSQAFNDVSGNPWTVANFPVMATNIYGTDTVFSKLRAHVAPYTLGTVADICGCSEAQIVEVANLFIANSRCSSVASDSDAFSATINDPKLAGYASTTMLYAMGLTQHTCGSQNVKAFAVLQTLLGNMGRAGGGINALRGIHNVQGSTDMGLLYGNIPAYSGNPSGTFAAYQNGLFGNRVDGSGAPSVYTFGNNGLQQKGFYSMTRAFFSDTSYRDPSGSPAFTWGAGHSETPSTVAETQANIDGLYALWPKGNGDNHIKMFRKMQPTYAGADKIKACVVWGQNPAVTEPNQSKVRAGLKELDLLVCVDMFENETAACDRKTGGVTYLIPACSHVEEAGSATNSGRTLQWRYQACPPKGNSKTDLELLMRFAKALDGAGAFNHIKQKWQDLGVLGGNAADAWNVLYGNQYGWTWGGTFNSETSAEKVYKQMCAPQNNGGTIWIYLEAWDTVTTTRGGGWPAGQPNRAKSRVKADSDNAGGGRLMYKNWGYAWLVNRRVLYQTGDLPWDQADVFVGPEQVAKMFTTTNSGIMDYAVTYRTNHRLSDIPKTPSNGTPSGGSLAGRFPWHTEPYESPRPELVTRWGLNTVVNTALTPGADANGARNLIPTDTVVGNVADYPLVLTTIRCVEHFQGGPITRNNSFNVEAEPEPWIEINSVDARRYGIKDGDWVNVITARSNSTTDQTGRTIYTASTRSTDTFGMGFKARVGVGTAENQRVKAGVVAIPWHWGDRGLSTGARANDLTVDAMDANTTIPEFKACLCKIEPA